MKGNQWHWLCAGLGMIAVLLPLLGAGLALAEQSEGASGAAAKAGITEQGVQGPRGIVVVRAELAARAKPPVPGGLITVHVLLGLKEGWHVYANPPGDDLYRPTAVRLDPEAPVKMVAVDYPAGKPLSLPDSPAPVMVYESGTRIPVRLTVNADAKPGPAEVSLVVEYQACNDRACLPPTKLVVPVRLNIAAPAR